LRRTIAFAIENSIAIGSNGKRKNKKCHMVPMPVYLLSRCSLQFMNIKVEKCASDIFVLCGVKIFPAVEKDLSIGPDDAGIARYIRANVDSRGNLSVCSLQ
jgi:hypothetical protein